MTSFSAIPSLKTSHLVRSTWGKARPRREQIALACLARVDLNDQSERPPHHLSFGERKLRLPRGRAGMRALCTGS